MSNEHLKYVKEIEKSYFKFYLILMNLDVKLDNHLWLMPTVLDTVDPGLLNPKSHGF